MLEPTERGPFNRPFHEKSLYIIYIITFALANVLNENRQESEKKKIYQKG